MIQETIDLHYNSDMFITICVNLIFPMGLSQCGIVYQIIMLLVLVLVLVLVLEVDGLCSHVSCSH